MVRSSTVLTVILASFIAKFIWFAFGGTNVDELWIQISTLGNLTFLFVAWYVWALATNKKVV